MGKFYGPRHTKHSFRGTTWGKCMITSRLTTVPELGTWDGLNRIVKYIIKNVTFVLGEPTGLKARPGEVADFPEGTLTQFVSREEILGEQSRDGSRTNNIWRS